MNAAELTIEQALEQFARAASPAELRNALQAIAVTGDARGVEPLIRALTFNDAMLYEVAVQGLIAAGEPAVEPLLASLERMDYGARYQALRALVAIADPRARPAYEHWIAADIAPSVRRICVKGLGQFFPDTARLLFLALKDKDWAVRYCAIQVLADCGIDPESRAALEALRSDPERVVRLKLTQVLG